MNDVEKQIEFMKTKNIRWKKEVIGLLNELCLCALNDNFNGVGLFTHAETKLLIKLLQDKVSLLPEKSRPKDLLSLEMRGV